MEGQLYLFRPVFGSSGLHQSLPLSIGVGSSTGDSPAPVSGRLAGCGGVSSPSPLSPLYPTPVVQELVIVVNWEKKDLEPSSCVQYLGMLIDTSWEKVFPSDS